MSLLLLFGGEPPPVNIVLPVITGQPAQVGHSITATTGTWTNSPVSYSYQWFRALTDGTGSLQSAILTDEDGNPLVDIIPGATSAEYLITSDDVNEWLLVEVTARTARGASAYVDVMISDAVRPALDTDGGFARKKKKRKYKALLELDEIRAEIAELDRLRKLRKLAEERKKSAEIKRNDDEEALLALLH